MKTHSYIIQVLLLLSLVSSCRRERHPIPEVLIDEIVYLNNPSSLPLQTPGGAIYHPGGYKGLIIYRRTLTHSFQDFAAYDRSCPQHWDQQCGRLDISKDMMWGVCACDSTRYLLFDGVPIDGQESLPMKHYRVTYDGLRLRITN